MAGGRYDSLLSILAGRKIDGNAIGFAAGIDRLSNELDINDILK